MKKILSILGLVSVIGLGSFAFAADGVENTIVEKNVIENGYSSNGHHSMREYHRKDLDKALENKEISEEEAKKWDEHYKYMEEFHNENGYGSCHSGRKGRGHGMGMGHRYQN